MKNYYFAINCDYTGNPDLFTGDTHDNERRLFADVLTVPESDNLLSAFSRIGGLISVNSCPTKKAAKELADFWNDCYKKNGTYAFRRATA